MDHGSQIAVRQLEGVAIWLVKDESGFGGFFGHHDCVGIQ